MKWSHCFQDSMSSVETVSGQVAGAAQNGSPSNSTNHSPKASLKKAIGSENKNQGKLQLITRKLVCQQFFYCRSIDSSIIELAPFPL